MRAAPVALLTAVGVIAAVGVGVAVASDTDDVQQVDAVALGAVTVDATPDDQPTGSSTDSATGSSSTASSSPTSSAQQVAGLERLQGVLTRDDSDDDNDDEADDRADDRADERADFEVAGVDLDLGPDEWLLTAGPVGDFDGDGTLRPVLEELEALLGTEVTVAGRYEDDGSGGSDDDLDVYEIQGLTFRDSAGGPAPWQTAGTGVAGDGPSREELGRIAADAVGADSRVDSVDTEDDGGAAWEVEVVDAYGVEQRVLLDAAGVVLDIRPED